ncbi:insulinase family protein [Bacillus sp. NSP9.1]|uniref:insulinase family protein n=1 Tax=Bacillus sp. NSP9.1 TaxID=1071078 RepID=UPI000423ACC8|nr:insulinase family protein [Bacillus sp. NSP9.1]QHZ47122.1 peptidase M16 [Bacillus sp. NSP9.1]
MTYESQAYRLLQQCRIEELKSEGVLLQHIKSGARVVLIANQDDNKVFNIGFRTPPSDNTGAAHILEHSVLCGSSHFPAKDTFVELAKGTLNTFLNAMTFPDKTIYPVASRNERDFQNLMRVYMDAVLRPNIYQREEIFLQEGWHYSLESPDAELQYNGVVYNEMKGAFSNPDSVMQREVLRSLFPDTVYAYAYGGLPEEIPQLKYTDLLTFHQKYYHPSNSFIYLYGNMNMDEKLAWLDECYLSEYEVQKIDSEIPFQAPFGRRAEVEKSYSIGSQESELGRVVMSYNAVVGKNQDIALKIAFQVLQYALINAPGAPLKQALMDCVAAKEAYAAYNDSIGQPVFSIIAKNGDDPDKEKFASTITSVLQKLINTGIDQEALLAGVNSLEFQYREADFGSFPKGLVYGLQVLGSWLYDPLHPFVHLETNKVFDKLRAQIHEGFFEQLVERYLLNNPHASIVVLVPSKGLNMQKEQLLKEQLQAYKNRLGSDEIQELVDRTEALKAYKSQSSTLEERCKLPLLSREDIDPRVSTVYPVVKDADGTAVLYNKMFTNGIGYLQILFDLKAVPDHLLPYVGILKGLMTRVDTERYSSKKLSHAIDLHTGGIFTSLATYGDTKQPDQFKATFEVHAKVLYGKLDFALEMIPEIILTSSFKDSKRIYELIAEMKSREQKNLISAGHQTAIERALSYHSKMGNFRDLISGITHFQKIEQLERNFQSEEKVLIAALEELVVYIFRPENMLVNFTADDQGYARLEPLVTKLKSSLYTEPKPLQAFDLSPSQRNDGFITSSEVQYTAQSGNFLQKGFAYTGSLRVLKTILAYDYLWQNIRVEGGAYGCMNQFQRNGDSYLASYRDPHLNKTYEVFARTPEFIQGFAATETEMTRYILGAIRELDAPVNPYGAGLRSLSLYLTNYTLTDLQKERAEILRTTSNDIVKLASLVEAILDYNSVCTIGSESKLKQEGRIFKEVLPLYQ